MAYLILSVVLVTVIIVAIYNKKKQQQQRVEEKKKAISDKLVVLDRAIDYLNRIRYKDCLTSLLQLHRELCGPLDLNNYKNLGPCSWGMFRTKDISTMKEEEVFLGDIYGLWTKPLSFWKNQEGTVNIGYDVIMPIKTVIYRQYWHHIISNLEVMRANLQREISKL